MTQLLVINSSPNGDYSKSTALTKAFTEQLTAQLPELNVTVRDLGKTEVPHLNPVTLSGFFTPPTEHNDAQTSAIATSNELIEELKAADIVLIGAAMHNYMVTSGLKAWIDQVTRAGVTFNYTETGPKGHLTGKQVYVIKTSGGDYSQAPMKAMDFLQPYLTFALGFIGLSDAEFINYGGAAMGEEMAKKAEEDTTKNIAAAVAKLSEQFASGSDVA